MSDLTKIESVFADRVRQVRKDRGLSQAALAKKLGELGFPLDSTAITRLEKHERSVRLGEAVAFAEALGVDLAYLAGLPAPISSTPGMKQEFFNVARGLVTGQLEERIAVAWFVFSSQFQGGAS